MKRHTLTRAALAAGIVALMVLAPTPALAVQPPPPPVDAVPLLPSTTVRMTQGASGTWSVQDYFRAWAYLNRPNTVATIPKPAPIPITAPSAWTKVAGGANMFSAAFSGGLVLGAQGLNVYGALTNTNPGAALCSQDAWVQTGAAILSLGMGPSCVAPLAAPNADTSAGTKLVYGGATATFLGRNFYDRASSNPLRAMGYSVSGTMTAPAGTFFAWKTTSGAWYGHTGTSLGNGPCFAIPSQATVNGTRCLGSSTVDDISPTIYLVQNWTTTRNVVGQSTTSSGDPARAGRCQVDWEDGTSTSASFGTYHESAGFPVSKANAACTEAYVSKPGHGPGLMPSRIKIGSTDTESGSQTEIADQEVPEYTEAERKGLDAGDGTGLKLWKITAAGKSSCMTWAADCRGWWTKTDQATNEGTGAEKFRCEFGGKKVDLAECGVYRNTFEEQTDNPKITDPESGESTDWTALQEGTGNSTDPGDAITPGQKCLSEWSEVPNPIEFVLQPVKCALVWAFVPRAAKVDEFGTKLDQKWKQSTPGQYAATFTALGTAFTLLGDGNCGGIPINLPTGVNADGTPDTAPANFMYACDGIMAPVATATFWIMTVSIGILGLVAIKLQLDRFVGNT